MACTAGCRTRDHNSYGECLRSKGAKVQWLETVGSTTSYDREKQWNRDLNFYESAIRQGIEPEGTSRQQVQDAMILSDLSGKAFGA